MVVQKNAGMESFFGVENWEIPAFRVLFLGQSVRIEKLQQQKSTFLSHYFGHNLEKGLKKGQKLKDNLEILYF